MRILPPLCTATAACLLIAGCAAPRSPSPAPRPVAAADSVDGEYRGTATRYQADSRGCPRPGLVSVIVFADRFQYRWDHDTWLDAAIGTDGAVHAEAPGITLHGQRTGTRIEGDVSNGVCGLHFTVARRAT